MNRDLSNRINVATTLAPATRNAAANGTGVNLNENYLAYSAAAIVAVTGAVTDGTHSLTIQESADNATWANVAASDLTGTFANLATNTVQEVSYMGSKPYIRVNSASSGTTGASFAVVVVRGNPRSLPV